MIWILQIPAPIMGSLTVAFVVAFSVGGLVVFRKLVPHTRLEGTNEASGHIFQLAGVLYAVLVAFVVVVVWEQFGNAESAAGAEANAIADLLRDSASLPPRLGLPWSRVSSRTHATSSTTSFRV